MKNASFLKKIHLNPLTFLSAFLVVISFPPWDLTPLIWISLVPWIYAIFHAENIKNALFQGFWLCMLMTIGGYSWVAYSVHRFGELPWSVGVLAVLLFGTFNQIQFTVFAGAFFKIKKYFNKNPVLFCLTVSTIYTAIDWTIPKLFKDTLGHSLYLSTFIRQAADLGGANLLTFLIVSHNIGLTLFLTQIRERKKVTWKKSVVYLIPLSLSLVSAIYGYWRTEEIATRVSNSSKSIQLAVIQANIGDFDKVAAKQGAGRAANYIVDKFLKLSDNALSLTPRPDALIWPETSYPSLFGKHETPQAELRDQRLRNYVKTRNVNLLFGGYDKEGIKEFNAVFFLSPEIKNGSDYQYYRKSILLPFGEYIPFMEDSLFMRNQFPQMGFFGRGEGPRVLKIYPTTGSSPSFSKVIYSNPIVCYEALFSEYVNEAARKGSELILNVTNDSWFGPFGEPQLHLALTVFRSIETHIPQIRSTNTGISAYISADGTLEKQTGIGREEIMNVTVPIIENRPTLVTSWGNWFGPTTILMSLILMFVLLWSNRRSETTVQ